jgi:hypothetical protein
LPFYMPVIGNVSGVLKCKQKKGEPALTSPYTKPMNYLFFSPHFPGNFHYFVKALADRGIKVFGIGPMERWELSPILQRALTDYVKVGDLENYDYVYRSVAYLSSVYGKFDRYESHNEHWLEQDARIRTDFNIPGLKVDDAQTIKRKSKMKAVFRKLKIQVADGAVITSLDHATSLAASLGYPVLVKPDKGVGATYTYRLDNPAQLKDFYTRKPPIDFILEEYIDAPIETFDGLVDQHGKLVFTNSFVYNSGVMDLVNKGLDMYYYTRRVIPKDLEKIGKSLVKAFDLKERFFHFEFFRLADGTLMALEVNVRPPGGLSMDMFNYANDEDFYGAYADVVLGQPTTYKNARPYHVIYIGLKNHHLTQLRTPLDVSLAKLKEHVVFDGPVPDIFSAAMGNRAIMLRHPDEAWLLKATEELMALSST